MTNRPSLLVASLLLSGLAVCAVACTSGGDEPGGTPTPGSVTPGPDGGTCSGDGNVAVTITGVPSGQSGQVTLTGPGGTRTVSADGSVTLASGEYAVTLTDVVVADSIARTVYRAAAPAAPVRVCGGGPDAALAIAYAPVGSSGKVWASNANGSANVLGWAASALAATSSQPASVVAKTQGAGGIAFDREGNLWAVGATTADPTLVRYPAASLAASGTPTADRKIDLKGTGCSPAARNVAFDSAGNLWVSVLCEKRVVRLAPADLAGDGEITASVAIGGFTAPKGIAFDAAGNLWVADDVLRRVDAGRLAASSDAAADLSLTVPAADSEALAFDAAGDLWSVGGSQVNLTRIAKADLGGTGARAATPAVAISLGALALPEGIAFDETGGLWTATAGGKFARLAPAQLATSSTYADPTVPERVITSTDVGSAGSFAIYPAPAGLPLYHRLP